MKVFTTWEYSSKTEAERLLQCAHQIAIGFYRVNNFIVLPFNPKVHAGHTVTFPDLPYNKIPRFWEQAKKINISKTSVVVSDKLLIEIIKMIEIANLSKPNFTETQKKWDKAQDEVINEIYKLIPAKKDLIKKIIIYPTTLGTSSSFSVFKKNEKAGEIRINLRDDQGIHAIAESILSCITLLDVAEDLDGVWSESELLVDWLVTKSSLSKVLQKYEKAENYVETIKGIRTKQQARLLAQSEDFYKKLGVPNFSKPFSLNGLTPEINKNPVENLSIKERLILKKLIEKSNSVISFDEIADEVFTDENEFSLYAISKTIQRLRNKLEANGISGSYIQTLRGKGYLLKN